MSLAAKCRLLFGLAVVLIIGSALFVPWYSFEALVHARNLQRTSSLALLARAMLDPTNTDWAQQQARLDQWWADNADLLRRPKGKPLFVQLATPEAAGMAADRLRDTLDQINRLATPPLTFLAERISPPPPANLAIGMWNSIPEHLRRKGAETALTALRHAGQAFSSTGMTLDSFQRKCVQTMSADENLNEMEQTERKKNQPTIYRFALAVRGEDTGSGRKPLLGLIDMRIESQGTDTALFWTRVIIILAGLLAGFLAILVFYLIVQKLILAPVRELTALAEDIAGGNLSARPAITTGDEFEELGDAFNEMLARLEKARLDLETTNKSLDNRVSELATARAELETVNRSLDTRLGELAESNVALYEANRIKSEFLANVSHELRTPLASIIGFADLLRDSTQTTGEMDRDRLARYTHNIMTSGRLLLDLINDLLELAKIEVGRVDLHRSRFSLTDICEALADFTRPLIEKKELTLNVNMEETMPMMFSDAGKVRQVLYNLLSNAIKYTPLGGTIGMEARLQENNTHVTIIVSDTGPGIDPADHERIFEKFRQLDSSVTREHGGSGLGLAISKELISMLGGTIRVESEIGKGARFFVTLPLECPASVQRPKISLT